MGGQAFASGLGAVFTPRMRPHVYRIMRDRCQEKLRELYVVVATPIEGPAKTSYGDIDLLVAWKRDEIFPLSRPAASSNLIPKSRETAISQVLGAIRTKTLHACAITLAIPWPSDIPYSDDGHEGEQKDDDNNNKNHNNNNNDNNNNNEDETPRCIQVDVHVCDTLSNLEWLLFRNAHGDLWNLLGSTMRPFGLTIDEVGFHIRIPEMESVNKKKARVLLTTNPGEIINFLGLELKCDGAPWTEPFSSDEDLFEYVSTCWLFRVFPKAAEGGEKGGGDEEEEEKRETLAMTEDKSTLKANDRRRMRHRPLFKKWIEEYIPACRAAKRFTSYGPSRDFVRECAFARFPGSQRIYDLRLKTFLQEQQARTIGNVTIKGALPADLDPSRRSACASALKKLVLTGRHPSNHPGFAEITAADPCRGRALRGPGGLFDEARVAAWVGRNWPRVMELACEVHEQRVREKKERRSERWASEGRERKRRRRRSGSRSGSASASASESEKEIDGDKGKGKEEEKAPAAEKMDS